MLITAKITAVGAVAVLANCTVNLYIDGGEEVNGQWISKREMIAENVQACRQRAQASQVARFNRGGERREGWARIFLPSEPSQKPDWVETGGEFYRVYDTDERESRIYHELLVAREFNDPE